MVNILKKVIDDTKKRDLISDIDELFDKSVLHKRRFARQWFINLAYLIGHQWLGFGYNGEIYDLLNQQYAIDGRVRMVENHYIIAVMKMVARILRQNPILDVVPNSRTLKDVNASKGAERTLRYLWEKLAFKDDILPILVLDTAMYGTSFLKIYWDPEAGDDMYLPKIEEKEMPKLTMDEEGLQIPVTDEKGKTIFEKKFIHRIGKDGQPEFEKIRLGEIAVDIPSPYDVHFNLEAQTFGAAEKIIIGKERSVDYVKDKYGVELTPEVIFKGNYENKIKRLLYSDAEYTEDKKAVLVKEYYEKPSNKYPKGRFAITAQGKVLEYREDYPYGEIPIVPFYFFRINNRIWGESLAKHLVPVQKQLNMVVSKIIANTRLMANPKWLVPKGSGIKNSGFTEKEGELIEYDPDMQGNKPQQITAAPLPSYVEGLYGKLKQSIMDISSQHEVSQGRVPPGVESGPAIMALQESDELILSPVIKGIEKSYERTGEMLLRRAKQFYKEERKIKIIGENNQLDEVYMFNQADLQDQIDVRVRSASGLPITKSGKMQTVFDLVNRGILNPQNDRKVILHLLDIPEINEEIGVDEKMAKLELIFMSEGQPAQVMDWQDHVVHLMVHEEYMNGQEFLKLPEEIKQGFVEHRNLHKQAMVEKQAEEMAMQQQAQNLAMQAVPPPAPPMGPEGMPPQGQEQMPPEAGGMPPMGEEQMMPQGGA